MTEHIHSTIVDGFEINLYALPEYYNPRDHFATGDDDLDDRVCDRIASGDLLWFCANVTASKAGVLLGEDYLGCCCYDSFEDFIRDANFGDMISEAIHRANTTLAKLVEC